MTCRHPQQWLILNGTPDDVFWRRIRRLPRGGGVLVLGRPSQGDERRVRYVVRQLGLTVAREPKDAARVHDMAELRRALLRRVPAILLSPIYPTRSHPDWSPLPRMRAAAMARLAGRNLIALGGMDSRRFAQLKDLGFVGWAGISAFRT